MNPMMMLIQQIMQGGNPIQLMRIMAPQSPDIAQALNLVEGKSPGEIDQTAANMFKERGLDFNQFANQIRHILKMQTEVRSRCR